jgi:small subunit ribosomal protein S4
MGDPRRQGKKYERPFRPWDQKRIEKEKEILKEYGLRRKSEIWKSEAILRKMRRLARKLSASKDEKMKEELLGKAQRLGLVGENPKLDDVLSLQVENVLERRLQSIVYKKKFADTPKQARQFVVHGHVKVGDKIMKYPSFLVPRNLEDKISLKIKKAGELND